MPAPPVSELAKPLRSAAHIDRDILESLRIIWGRHADPNLIKADLLSPEGEGTLSKAFYFLLQKHREKTLGEHGFVVDYDKPPLPLESYGENDGNIITKWHTAPDQLEVSSRPRNPHGRSSREAPAPPPPCYPSLLANPVASLAPPTVIETYSRPRPPSPIGPRPPKPRPQSTPIPGPAFSPTNTRHSRMVPGHDMSPVSNKHGSPRLTPLSPPSPSPSPYTSPGSHSPYRRKNMQRSTYVQHGHFTESPQKISDVRFPSTPPPQFYHHSPPPVVCERTHRPTSTLPPGVHLNAAVPMSPRATAPGTLPTLTAPRTQNAEFQRAIDDLTERVNALVARGTAEQPPYPPSHGARYTTRHENSETRPVWMPHRQPNLYPPATPITSRPDDRGIVSSANKENQAEAGTRFGLGGHAQKSEEFQKDAA